MEGCCFIIQAKCEKNSKFMRVLHQRLTVSIFNVNVISVLASCLVLFVMAGECLQFVFVCMHNTALNNELQVRKPTF